MYFLQHWMWKTFSVRAATIARMATSTDASHMATGGLLLLALLRTVTPCIRARRLSILRITVTAATVLPFAVWYGRDERGSNPISPFWICADGTYCSNH